MQFQDGEPGLRGQELVFDAWRKRLHGRRFIARDELDIPSIISELAHVSVLACEGECFRFRLAGTGLRAAFGCEAKGMSAAEIEICRGSTEWTELPPRRSRVWLPSPAAPGSTTVRCTTGCACRCPRMA